MNKPILARPLTLSIFALSILSTPWSVEAQLTPPPPPPNDTARFLAGIPLPKNSPLEPLTHDLAWVEHSANFEKAFAKLNTRQLQKLHAWQAQYLPESLQPVPVAFYMFSGPDFLYVDQFFPRASVYVLCGKESMGPPPDPLRIANLSAALYNLEDAMNSSLRFSFFITKDMKVDLGSQELKGTLPILYVFLARADKSITDVTFGSLNGNSAFQAGRPGRGGAPGVGIEYLDIQSRRAHFGVGGSLLKSSSSLMFEDGFNRIRNFVLYHSRTIVQDDAGIPLAYFNRDKRTIRAFGNYIGPIEIFKQHYQPKLMELYQQTNPTLLTFNFGYRWNYKESNI